MATSKIESYIGFAIKANKILTGDFRVSSARRAYVVISCKSASPRSVHEASVYAKRLNAPHLISVEKTLSEIVGKENCKMIAITDESLGNAIVKSDDKSFKKVVGEDK